MNRSEHIYVATVAQDCREAALEYGLGLESDAFCTALNLDDPTAVRAELATILAADTSATEKALTAFCRGARGQLFWDGNKRTGLMPANKILLYRLMVASPLH